MQEQVVVSFNYIAYVRTITDISTRIGIMTRVVKDTLGIAAFVATVAVFIGVHSWMYTH